MDNKFVQLRLALLRNGYEPLPIRGKACLAQKWTTFTIDEDRIGTWADGNTGIRCGATVAIDIDVADARLVDELEMAALEYLGDTPLRRVGRAPRATLVFRSADPLAAWAPTAKYAMPFGAEDAQVEILGARRQFVAYGIHPKTLRPFTWGAGTPETVPAEALPVVTGTDLAAFRAACDAILAAAGGIAKTKAKGDADGYSGEHRTSPKGLVGPIEDIVAALEVIPNNEDWHGWSKMGMAAWAASDEGHPDALAAWHKWSEKNTAYDSTTTDEKWEHFASSPATRIGIGSLVKLAWDADPKWKRPSEGFGSDDLDDAPPKPEPTPEPDPAAAAAGSGDPFPDDSAVVTEDSAALAFTRRHAADLRFDHHAKAWYRWTGTIWRRDETCVAFSWARKIAREIGKQSEKAGTIGQTGKAAFAGGVERFARTDPHHSVTSEIWNADPWLLGTPAGTVDLRTGELRQADQAEHITKATAVAPADTADCPQWLAFLRQSAGGDDDLVAYLRRWFGYCLTGITREHALLFVFGPGGNGKGVAMNTVSGILADYAVVAAEGTFSASKGDKHPTDLAMLAGARFCMTTETEQGQAWAEKRLKELTGGDPISARYMRCDFFQFTPQFKLTVSGNHKPALRNVDAAARRRFNLLPFVHKPEVVDQLLPEKLKAEWPGILRWMIDGCMEWQARGLMPPESVRMATEEYFEDQDTIGKWLTDRCDLAPGNEATPKELQDDCRQWALTNGEAIATPDQLKAALGCVAGVKYRRGNARRWWQGIALKPRENSGVNLDDLMKAA